MFESETRFRSIFENVKDVILFVGDTNPDYTGPRYKVLVYKNISVK